MQLLFTSMFGPLFLNKVKFLCVLLLISSYSSDNRSNEWINGMTMGSSFIIRLTAKTVSGADPGFPVGGAPTLGGHQHMISSNFPKNCMKLRNFWAVWGGAHRGRPPWIRH